MRSVARSPNLIHGFLIPLALPLVAEMFTAIGSATVPVAIRELPQSSALGLSDLPRQMVADSLTPRELNEFMRTARYEHQQLSKLRKNTIRRSPWSVQVRTSEGTTWLDPAEDEGWDQVEEILEANPRCLEQRPPSGKDLLERLPLPSWKGQALQAAKDGTEPPYLKILSRLLSFKLASIVELTTPSLSAATPNVRRVAAAQMIHFMYSFLHTGESAARFAAIEIAKNASCNDGGRAARDAADESALNAATKAAKDAALKVAGFASTSFAWRYSSNVNLYSVNYGVDEWDPIENAARDAARVAINQLVAQSPAGALPSAELIGRTAYRFTELSALLSVLRQVEGGQLFARLESRISAEDGYPIFANPAAWANFKNEQFCSANENLAHIWQPWLRYVDRFLDNEEHGIPSDGTLSTAVR